MNAMNSEIQNQPSDKDAVVIAPQLSVRQRRFIVGGLLLVHVLLLGWSAHRNSWTWDEVSFLPAGISHWHFGDFELFDVNPPLVRMVAAVPVLFADPELDWSGYTTNPTVRPERPIGEAFLRNNGERSLWLLTMARWACIPFSLLGGFVCYHWSRELFGDLSGLLALTLWCFSPTIIGHGQLITADVGGASIGILGFYTFWKWLNHPTWRQALMLGGVLGLMELTKSTWVVAFGLWPAIWLVWRKLSAETSQPNWFRREGMQLFATFTLAVYILNLGYGFQGTGKLLGDYEFISTAIGGSIKPGEETRGQLPNYPTGFRGTVRNRFTGTLLGQIPVLLPQKYVEGIDRQKSHFEWENWSYLGGVWQRGGGWWYYYLYALSLKTPHGTWLLALCGVLGVLFRKQLRGRLRDEMFLVCSMLLLFTFVSLQTGINRHLRYTLSAFPFAFILISRVGILLTRTQWKFAVPAGLSCLFLIFSALSQFPHHLSYFNELAGGPTNGGKYLTSSNVDWGQDLRCLQEWTEENPGTSLDGLGWHCRAVDPAIVGIIKSDPPKMPSPGWYAVSQNRIYGHQNPLDYFQQLTPNTWAGPSIAIFHVSTTAANQLRDQLCYPRVGSSNLVKKLDEIRFTRSESPVFASCSESNQLIVGFSSGQLNQYQPYRLSPQANLATGEGRPRAGKFFSNGRSFVAGWSNGKVAIYDELTTVPRELDTEAAFSCLDVSPDGQFLAIGDANGNVQIRYVSAPEETIAVLPHSLSVLTTCFVDNGRYLATGTGNTQSGTDGQVQLWDTMTWEPQNVLPESATIVKTMCTSQGGSMLAARGADAGIRIWNFHDDTPSKRLPYSEKIMTLQFTADSQYLVGGGYRGLLKIWNAQSGRLEYSAQAHSAKVTSCCILGSTGQIVTTGADNVLKLWDASTLIGGVAKPVDLITGIERNDSSQLKGSLK